MAKRPQFNLPSTKPAGDTPKTEWVYRSDATGAVAPPVRPAGTDPERIVARYSQLSAAAGFIPVPGLNLVACGGLQLKMIAELCAHYAVPFSSQLGKSLIAALAGTIGPARIGMSVVPILGIATGPALGYTATWTIGRIFQRHFAAGGTLANFDAELPANRVDAQLS